MKKPVLFGEVHTDDDYRRVIRRRIIVMWMFIAAGAVAIAISAVAKLLMKDATNDHMLDYYMGVGVGIIAGSAVTLVRSYRLLKNDTKLRQSRIANCDERAVDLSRRAMCIATYVTMCVVYVACLIVGLFWYPATQILVGYVSILLITYLLVYKILMKRM